MAEGGRKRIPTVAPINLRRRLDTLPPRHPERITLLQNAASLYGVSRATLYRQPTASPVANASISSGCCAPAPPRKRSQQS